MEISQDAELGGSDLCEDLEFLMPPRVNGGAPSTYSETVMVIHHFIGSKRCARDRENIEQFIKPGPRSNCARVDAVYRRNIGLKSHIKVQDNEQYWAELEKRFPHLKEVYQPEEDNS